MASYQQVTTSFIGRESFRWGMDKLPINFDKLRIFGCLAYVQILSEDRSKLDPKLKKRVFFGYSKGVKEFKLWDPILMNMVVNRDVVIDEQFMLKQSVETNEFTLERETSSNKVI